MTIDGTTYTATCTAAGDPATWSDFVDADDNTLDGEDGRPGGDFDADTGVLTLTSTSTYSVDSAASYLGDPDPVESDDIQDVEAENFYENNGRDIIELHASFGDDTVVDFETGVDQINVQALLGSDSPVESASATGLTDKNVFVGTVTTGPTAASGIYTQSEVTNLYGTEITFTGTKGTALVFLDDGAKDADNNVYTVVQVTASAATVMGSLSLAEGESIAATDLVGISQLVDDPVLA